MHKNAARYHFFVVKNSAGIYPQAYKEQSEALAKL